MAIAHRSSATATALFSTSLTISAPAGLVDGDIMIAVVNSANFGNTWTSPAGWTLIDSSSSGGGGTPSTDTYYKRASSESGNYAFTLSGTDTTAGAISAFSGCIASGSPIDVHGLTGDTNGAHTTATAASVTTTTANDMLVYYAGLATVTSATYTADASYTESAATSTGAAVELAYKQAGSAGASGTAAATYTNASANVCGLIALLAVPSVGTAGFFAFFKG